MSNGTTTEVIHNLYGNDLLGTCSVTNTGMTRNYFLKDHLGSIKVIVNEDGSVASYTDGVYLARGGNPFGLQLENRYAADNTERYKFTGKERDTETSYDYFGARYYDSKIGRWLQVDPMDEKHANASSYNYCFNNPLIVIDPTGKDSTFYIRPTTEKIDEPQVKEVKDQVKNVLDQNSLPLKVEVLPINGFKQLAPTDVMIDLADDSQPLIKKVKATPGHEEAEGYSPGSQLGVVTVESMGRKGITAVGLGNMVGHEGFHAMGIEDHTPNTIMSESFGPQDINKSKQYLNEVQRDFILNNFLKKQN